MTGFTTLTAVGFGYGTVLQENFPDGESSFLARLICELGLASVISLVGLASLWLVYRRKLNGLMRDCRWLVTKLLECRQETSFHDAASGVNNNMKPTNSGITETETYFDRVRKHKLQMRRAKYENNQFGLRRSNQG
jgi:hypothetical protein